MATGRGNLPNAERRMPNAERRTPNAERRTPNAERRTPNAERRTPNAERRTPNAERRTPNAERLISVSGISCETCAFCKHGSHRDYRYLGQVSPVLPNCFALLRCSLLWSIVTVAIFSFSLSAMNRIQIMTFTQSDSKGKLFIFQNQKSLKCGEI